MTGSLEWLVVALILVPIAGAALTFFLGLWYPRTGWMVTMLTLGLTGVITLVMLPSVFDDPMHSAVGNIPVSYGIELVLDGITMVLVVLTLLVITGATVHLRRTGPRGSAFYSGILLLTGGTLGITLAGDLFNLYVFLEISAIASYALISSADSRVATYASFKYLLLGTLGATLYLLGVGYVFVATGTLNMTAVAASFAEIGYTDPVVVTSFALIGVGLAIKIALFPLHTWLADAHAAAPDAISAIVSGLLPAVAVYALTRIALSVYTVDFFAANPAFETLLLYGGLITVFAGSIFALLQPKIKLLLAYSTIAQMGLAVVGVALATEQSVYGAMVQLFGHGIVKAALFLLAGIIAIFYGARHLDEYAGLATRSPWLAGAFAVLGISLIGIPPTVGFMGKYYIVLGAIESGSWLIAILVILSTLLTIAYIVPIIDRLYFHPYEGAMPDRRTLPGGSTFVVAVAVILAVTIGVVTVPIGELLEPAIEVMVT